MKNINEVILHPVRMRIIQELSTKHQLTANELGEIIDDIPRTTLYRHIKLLIDHHILIIEKEQKIRGSLERTLKLNLHEITKHNTIENAADNAFGFLMAQYAKFHDYFNENNPNPAADRIFLNNRVMLMDNDEFDQFIEELRQLLLKYSFDKKNQRIPRDISIISSPVAENKGERL